MSRQRSSRTCPRCGKSPSVANAPFCSAGCQDRDLLDWLGERHVLPGSEPAETLDNAGDDA